MGLKERLLAIGMGEKSAEVYLALLRIGAGSATEVSREAGIKRPTTYLALEELLEQNLISQSFDDRRRIYSIENPTHLLEHAEKQVVSIKTLLPELQALYNRTPRKPRIRYFEGREGIIQVNEDLLTVKAGEYHYFGSVKEIVDVVGRDYLEDFVRRRVEKKIWAHAIRIREKEIDAAFTAPGHELLRRVRYFKEPILEDVAVLYVYDDKVGITSALGDNYGLIIESYEMVVLMRALWKIVWSVSEEP